MNQSVRIVLLVLLSALCTGCGSVRRYDLLFQDERTGKPVPGVRLEAMLWGHHFNNRLFPAKGNEDSTPSDSEGRASVRLTSGDGLWHYLAVKRSGYHAILGQSSPGEGVWNLRYAAGDVLPSETTGSDMMVAVSSGAPVVIKMRKLDAPR
jgi:hypothetical protein